MKAVDTCYVFLAIFLFSTTSCEKQEDNSSAATKEAEEVTQTTATLRGIVNASGKSTTVTFEYGLNTDYGQTISADQSPVMGDTITTVSADIKELNPNTSYHYRIIAANSAGTITGDDLSFTTLAQFPWLIIRNSGYELVIRNISPDTVITTSSMTLHANYALDINEDNFTDINFVLYRSYMGGGMVWSYSSMKMEILNNEISVLTDSIYPIVLSLGDTVRIEDKWGNGNLTLAKASSTAGYPPVGNGVRFYGNWNGVENKYIGIKWNNRLGWIKTDASASYLKVYETALQK